VKEAVLKRFFIAWILPEDLAAGLEFYRTWLRDELGCRSGQRTPLHVTLIAPFDLDPVRLGALEKALFSWAAEEKPFETRFDGFGAFGKRTLYARLEPQDLWKAKALALQAFLVQTPGLSDCVNLRKFQAHATVANRDIPEKDFERAFKYLTQEDFQGLALADHAALLEWKDGRWLERQKYYFLSNKN